MNACFVLFVLAMESRCVSAWAQASAPTTRPAAPSAVEALTQNLTLLTGNNAPEARRIGARGLLAARSPQALARLTAVLQKEDDPQAQLAACQEIALAADPPPELIEPVLLLLSSGREDLGREAGLAFSRFRPEQVVPLLRKAARGGGSSAANGRRAAIAALGGLGVSRDAVQTLVELLDDPDSDVHSLALEALGRAAASRFTGVEEARKWWSANRDKSQTEWLAELHRRREVRIRLLDDRVEALSRRLVERCRGDYLQTPDSQKTARLVGFLNDPETALRGLGLELTNALITDRKPVPPEALPAVRALLADPSPDVRRQSAVILGYLRDPADVERLVQALEHESFTRVRAALVRALGRMGDARVLPVLEAALSQPSREVEIEALAALGAVAERLGRDDPAHRRIAALVAARFEETPDPDAARMSAFLETMRQLADPRFGPAFTRAMQPGRPIEARQAAIRGAAALDDPALTDRIAALLSDESPAIRLVAARELGRCGRSPAHLELLLARAQGASESNDSVGEEAWTGFSRLFAARPVPEKWQWCARLARDADAVGPPRVLELVAAFERQLADDAEQSALRPRVRELYADLCLRAGRFAEAAGVYQKLMAVRPSFDPDLAVRTLRALIRSGDVGAALALLGRPPRTNGEPPATQPSALIRAAIEECRELVVQQKLDAASALAQPLSQLDESELSTADRSALSDLLLLIEARRQAATQPASASAPASSPAP